MTNTYAFIKGACLLITLFSIPALSQNFINYPSMVSNRQYTAVSSKDEWNVYSSAENIGVIELRNYLIKEGKRDAFIDYFETHFIESQKTLNGYPIGQYRVKGSDDHFCWIRGFENMTTRSAFLPAFYHGAYWKQHRNPANAMIANSDNVHLLRPLVLQNDSLVPVPYISSSLLHPQERIAVVDFYIANTRLEQLLKLFGKNYLPILKNCGVEAYTLWVSEPAPNDFPALPVFQDKNLLVAITFYKDEREYQQKMKLVAAKMDKGLKSDLVDAITIKHSMILFPTKKTAGG